MGALRSALEDELGFPPSGQAPRYDATSGRPITGYGPETGEPFLGERADSPASAATERVLESL
jgi:hypothetical protein